MSSRLVLHWWSDDGTLWDSSKCEQREDWIGSPGQIEFLSYLVKSGRPHVLVEHEGKPQIRSFNLKANMLHVEREIIIAALEMAGYVAKEAADLCDISDVHMHRLLKKHGLLQWAQMQKKYLDVGDYDEAIELKIPQNGFAV